MRVQSNLVKWTENANGRRAGLGVTGSARATGTGCRGVAGKLIGASAGGPRKVLLSASPKVGRLKSVTDNGRPAPSVTTRPLSPTPSRRRAGVTNDAKRDPKENECFFSITPLLHCCTGYYCIPVIYVRSPARTITRGIRGLAKFRLPETDDNRRRTECWTE